MAHTIYRNNAETTLALGISSGAVSFTVADGSQLSVPGVGQIAYGTLRDAITGDVEVFSYTSNVANVLSGIVRNVDPVQGGTALVFSLGDFVEQRIPKIGIDQFFQRQGDNGQSDNQMTGDVSWSASGAPVIRNETTSAANPIIIPNADWDAGLFGTASGGVGLIGRTLTGSALPGGSASLIGGDGSNLDGAGGNVFVTAGAPDNQGLSGTVFVTGGSGSPQNNTDAGDVQIIGGSVAGAASSRDGGSVSIIAGVGGDILGDGGIITITSGSGGTTSGASGTVNIQTGATTSGSVGDINITSGSAADGRGGDLDFRAGASGLANTGGDVDITAGAGGATGNGGAFSIVGGFAGSTSGNGGAVSVQGGNANGDGVGGALGITAGIGVGANNGGTLTITGGLGGATGDGGAILITSGNAGITSGDSGDLTLATGTVTSGSTGAILLNPGSVNAVTYTESASSVIQDNQTDTGLTASTTQTQGNGVLDSSYNEVATVANDDDTVTLPTASEGRRCIIVNNGANTLQIFPASGDDLGNGVDSATTLLPGSGLEFFGIDSTDWNRIGVSGSSAASQIQTSSASGTEVDFTGIPSGVSKIWVLFDGISTNGTSDIIVQLGDSGGVEASGYVSASSDNTDIDTSTAGIITFPVIAAASVYSGVVALVLANPAANTWVGSMNIIREGLNAAAGSGVKSTSGTLDRIRITMVNGTDTFDAGNFAVRYE